MLCFELFTSPEPLKAPKLYCLLCTLLLARHYLCSLSQLCGERPSLPWCWNLHFSICNLRNALVCVGVGVSMSHCIDLNSECAIWAVSGGKGKVCLCPQLGSEELGELAVVQAQLPAVWPQHGCRQSSHCCWTTKATWTVLDWSQEDGEKWQQHGHSWKLPSTGIDSSLLPGPGHILSPSGLDCTF